MTFFILVAFVSPIFFAISGALDSNLAQGQKGHPLSFTFYLFIAYFLMSFVVFFYGNPDYPTLHSLLFLVPIAFIEIFYLVPYYKALKIADASVVAAMFMLSRIFIPIFAYILFNEQLYTIQYVGFGLIVVSCVLLSAGPKSLKKHICNTRLLLLMSFASGILAIQTFLYKYAMQEVSWDTAFFTVATLSSVFSLTTILLPKIRKDIKLNFSYAMTIWPIIFLEELMSALGSSTEVFSLDHLPVTVVKAIQSTYPFWVLFVAFLMVETNKNWVKEKISLKIEERKIALILILVIGVCMVVLLESGND
jgi:drug/metabolite transporter (DMT)-like permease